MTNRPGEGTPPERPDEERPGEQPWEQPGAGQPGEQPLGAQPPGEQPTSEQASGYQPGYWEQQSQREAEDRAREQAQQQAYQQGQVPYPPYGGYQQPYPQPGYPVGQYTPDHPRATTSLVLGILGVVLCQVAAPFAWWMGKRTMDEIDASGGTVGGRGAAQAGYILGIVGTVLLALGVIFGVIWLIIVIAAVSGGISTS